MASGALDGKDGSGNDLHVDEAALDRYEQDADTSALAIRSLDDIKRISTIFIGSGMFKGEKGLTQTQQLYQAGVKIIAGVEFGIQPFAAMRGINIIKGNAEMSANLMAAKVKKHPKYDYRVKQWDRDGCVIEFYELPYPGAPRDKWDLLGESSFDQEDARIARLSGGENWQKFARNMYFARAMSNGVRIYCPDVFYGAPVYVEGEISGQFDAGDSEPSKPEPTGGEERPDAEEADVVPEDDPEVTEAEVVEDDEVRAIEIVERVQAIDPDITEGKMRKLVFAATGKPFLKSCSQDDLKKLDAHVDRVAAGEETWPWLTDSSQAADQLTEVEASGEQQNGKD